MQIILPNGVETELFQLEEISQAEQHAFATDGEIYCWKTVGRSNWLERRLSVADVLALVVLPKNLPQWIDMPDDNGNSI